MRRLGLTMLATAWIVVVVVAWIWFGTTIHERDAVVGYWLFSWIPALIISGAPFVIYDAAS